MQNKTIAFSVLFLIVGVFLGWLIFSRATDSMQTGMHHMPNGEMMGMGDTMDGMMAGLSGKTGDDFDKAFIDEMIVHHQGAVSMAEAAQKNAKHQEIKDMASAIIAAQTKEIEQMKAWRTSWFSN